MGLPVLNRQIFLFLILFSIAFFLLFSVRNYSNDKNTLSESYITYKTYAEETYDRLGTYIPHFKLPKPGTYKLPRIKRIKDHILISENGKLVHLLELKHNKIAIVSFIYTNCPEKYGCPLATFVMSQVDSYLYKEKSLRKNVVLISISFDPERDTARVMKAYKKLLNPKTEWHFLTTSSMHMLTPVLEDFGQRIQKLYYSNGRWTGMYRHVLKIFLIDKENYIRNIYSTGIVSPGLILADVKTLLADNPH